MKWQIGLVMRPRTWDAWVILLYCTSFSSPCGLFSRRAVVISWKDQPCVVASTSLQCRQILCLTGISDIKLQGRKSTDLWETLHGHMHWAERALGTKTLLAWFVRERTRSSCRESSVWWEIHFGCVWPIELLFHRAVWICCQHPPSAVAVCWCALVVFNGLMGAGLEPTPIADVS